MRMDKAMRVMRTHEFKKLCGHTIRQSQTRSHPRSTHARNKGSGIGPTRPVPASLRLSLPFDDLVVMARVPHPIHPELGRESPQRRWYCVLRRGRVGRRQVFEGKTLNPKSKPIHDDAPPNPSAIPRIDAGPSAERESKKRGARIIKRKQSA